MKSKKRISLLAVLVCLFALVLSLGLMSACGNTDDKSASGNWFYGTEAPADGLGNNGDFYLNTETLTAYAKSDDGTWTPTTLYSGHGAPENDAGEKGDLYLDLDDKILYQKSESLWEIALKLQGEKGRDGVLWFSGDKDPDEYPKDDPAVKGAMKGDFYLKKGAFTIWQLTAEGWKELGSIKGDKGDNATQFYDGKGAPTEKNPENPNDGDLYLGKFDGFDGNGAGSRLYRYQDGKWNILMDTVKTNEVNIYNLTELQNFATAVAASQDGYVGKTVHLKADIDFNEPAAASMRKNAPRAVAWTPIGTKNNPFRGTFDGEGHTIKNFTTTAAKDATKVGFFGNISGATIEHLHFENVTIEASEAGSGFIGAAVVGQASGAVSFLDVTVTGNVEVQESGNAAKVGGLVGAVTEEGSVSVQGVEVSVSGLEHTDSGNEGGTLVGSSSGSVTFEGENEVSYSISEGFAETHHKSDSETTIIYEISNLDGLKYFRDSVNGTLEGIEANDYAGKTVVLTEDIDFSDEPEHPEDKWYSIRWTPIGKSGEEFSGTFDGQGHILKNLSKDYSNNMGAMVYTDFGLFGRTGDGAVFCNFTLENVTMLCRYDAAARHTQSVAAVVASPGTNNHFSNIHVVGNIAIKGSWYVGGIVGYGNTGMTIDGCEVNGNGEKGGTITLECTYAGGIVGYVQEGTRLTNNVVKNITFEMHENPNLPQYTAVGAVGGISGIAHAGCVITGSTVENVVFNFRDGAELKDAGAVAGIYSYSASSSTTIKDNHGSVEMYDHTKEFPITKLYNYGLVGEERNHALATNFEMENNNFSIKFQGVPYNTTTNEWSISSEEELSSFRDLVNGGMTFEGETVKLTDDIDLNNEDWTPIGTATNPFKGTFSGIKGVDGNYAISNLSIESQSGDTAIGFFGFTKGATLTNLTLNGVKIKQQKCGAGSIALGALVGNASNDEGGDGRLSTISHILLTGLVDYRGGGYGVGGICGRTFKIQLSDIDINVSPKSMICYNVVWSSGADYNKTNSASNRIGGVVGWSGASTYTDITTNLNVVGSSAVGGVVGLSQYSETFNTVTVNATVTGDAAAENGHMPQGASKVGAIVGCVMNNDHTFENIHFDGTIYTIDDFDPTYSYKVMDPVAIIYPVYYGLLGQHEGTFKSTIQNSVMDVNLGEGVNHIEWDAEGNIKKGAENTWNITSAAGLTEFRDMVNGGVSFINITVSLLTDIDLKGAEFKTIGDHQHQFAGTFDGQGNTISDFTLALTGRDTGFFGCVQGTAEAHAVVKNLNLDKVSDNVQYYATFAAVGAVAAEAYNADFENVHVTNFSMNAMSLYAGGLIGYLNGGSIKNCSVEATNVLATGTYGISQFGGLVCHFENGTIDGCRIKVSGSGLAFSNMGGLACVVTGNAEVKNCYVDFTLTESYNPMMVGGLVSQISGRTLKNTYTVTFANCYVKANFTDGYYKGEHKNIYGSEDVKSGLGGFAALGDGMTLSNCFVDGDIPGGKYILSNCNGDYDTVEMPTFEHCSWSAAAASYDYYGHQTGLGDNRYGTVTKATSCSFKAGMSYEDFLETLNTLNG